MAQSDLLSALAVTAELCGKVLSAAAVNVFIDDLQGFDEKQVLGAFARCRKEVRGMLTVSDVISRLDDGRPGAEEAWAMMPRSEADSVVWSQEMAEAFGAASPLLESGDAIGARMAFREVYVRRVAQARETKSRVRWTPSLGFDARQRETVIQAAIEAGKLPFASAAVMLAHMPAAQSQPARLSHDEGQS